MTLSGYKFWGAYSNVPLLVSLNEDEEKTLKEYITLCKAGGSESFFKLLDIGNLKNPMTTDILEEIVPKLEELLKNIEI